MSWNLEQSGSISEAYFGERKLGLDLLKFKIVEEKPNWSQQFEFLKSIISVHIACENFCHFIQNQLKSI